MEIFSSDSSLCTANFAASPGRPELQGATLVDSSLEPSTVANACGVNFAVYSPRASQLYLCLFDDQQREKTLKMYRADTGIWHLYIKGATAGQQYGFRAEGHWDPHASPRFNKHKLLLDPFAREVKGKVSWSEELFDFHTVEGQWYLNEQDSAACMPRSVVREAEFDWQGISRPRISRNDSIIYEAHVKGFTQTHPEIPEHLRGTYLGMCHPVAIEYLKNLGITAIELLPVTSMVTEQRLEDLGLKNYWGYNPLCLMAPEPSYAVADPVTEMKTMVRELHRAGIEVIMDVVFNHTGESGHGGPSLSMRGLAESHYYHMEHRDGQLTALNYTGCGNTLNFDSRQMLKLTMDSLRCWAEEYQIDGFRFDLAPTLARRNRMYCKASPFFYAIYQDPVLSQLKMIAEPWDIGPDGYHLADFPNDWQVWNDRYRDGCRKFWNGEQGILAEAVNRVTGSQDIFGTERPIASINYICSHDGFNLMDLVSYEQRDNYANGEENRDGDQHNYSWNHGQEGITTDPLITSARLRSRKNLLAMLMLARGTPMLVAGDEFSNSQNGNNNAYCQDSDISWLDWSWLESPEKSDGGILLDFTRRLVELRKHHPLLNGNVESKIFDCEGQELAGEQLYAYEGQCVCLRLQQNSQGYQHSIYIILNRDMIPAKVVFPSDNNQPRHWYRLLDTSQNEAFTLEPVLHKGWCQAAENSVTVIEEKVLLDYQKQD